MLLVPETYDLIRGTPEFNAFADELLREARLLHSLRHENIVQLRGVAMHPEHGHVQWLVTELADGGSLEKWVSARGRLTLAELLDLLRSVMRALVYLHSRTPAVLHRDIKPTNVLVFSSFGGGITWKLGDVGIAKVLQATQRAAVSAAGTILYMAPDVLLGPYDGRVDVFSTGIMAAELVVRYVDIAGFERVKATEYNLPEHRPALVDDACARLDTVCPLLSLVVRRCCAKKAKERMHSDVALRALDELDVGDGGGGGGGAPVDIVDMSQALAAMEALQIASDVSDRVCDEMVAAAAEVGLVTGVQFLQIVVDEGIKAALAMKLREKLRITSVVPPRRVRSIVVLFEFSARLTVSYADAATWRWWWWRRRRRRKRRRRRRQKRRRGPCGECLSRSVAVAHRAACDASVCRYRDGRLASASPMASEVRRAASSRRLM
jgi:hypothetical protein